MLETKCVGDNFKMLVTVLAFLVTNIYYRFTEKNERKMNLSGPSSYLAFIHCYSTNDIGFPAISSRSWVFVKLSLNKQIFQNFLPIILEGNRPIVQAAILVPL